MHCIIYIYTLYYFISIMPYNKLFGIQFIQYLLYIIYIKIVLFITKMTTHFYRLIIFRHGFKLMLSYTYQSFFYPLSAAITSESGIYLLIDLKIQVCEYKLKYIFRTFTLGY